MNAKDIDLVFAKQEIARLTHQMKQLEAMALAAHAELEVRTSTACAWAFEFGRKLAEVEDRYAGLRAPTDADTVRTDIFDDLSLIDPDITLAEKKQAVEQRMKDLDARLSPKVQP